MKRTQGSSASGGAPDHGESASADDACRGLLSAEARVTEEPGAGKPHAGICAGGASASLPRLAGQEVFMRRDRTLSAMLIVMGMLVARPSVGDTVPYGEVRDLRAEGLEFIIDHHHDWSGSTRKRRSKMMGSHQNPFTSENNYAYVSAKKKDTGVLLFRRPSPALSWIGVTADSRYIVGLSNIQLDNHYQLVVFDSTGQLIAKQHVTSTVS